MTSASHSLSLSASDQQNAQLILYPPSALFATLVDLIMRLDENRASWIRLFYYRKILPHQKPGALAPGTPEPKGPLAGLREDQVSALFPYKGISAQTVAFWSNQLQFAIPFAANIRLCYDVDGVSVISFADPSMNADERLKNELKQSHDDDNLLDILPYLHSNQAHRDLLFLTLYQKFVNHDAVIKVCETSDTFEKGTGERTQKRSAYKWTTLDPKQDEDEEEQNQEAKDLTFPYNRNVSRDAILYFQQMHQSFLTGEARGNMYKQLTSHPKFALWMHTFIVLHMDAILIQMALVFHKSLFCSILWFLCNITMDPKRPFPMTVREFTTFLKKEHRIVVFSARKKEELDCSEPFLLMDRYAVLTNENKQLVDAAMTPRMLNLVSNIVKATKNYDAALLYQLSTQGIWHLIVQCVFLGKMDSIMNQLEQPGGKASSLEHILKMQGIHPSWNVTFGEVYASFLQCSKK